MFSAGLSGPLRATAQVCKACGISPSEENQRPRTRARTKPCTWTWTWSGNDSRVDRKKTTRLEADPNPNLAPVSSGQVQLVQGLNASRQGSITKNTRSLEPDPAQTVHPPGLDRCKTTNKKTGARSEFERTLKSQRSRLGWSASGGGIIQFRARALVLSAPGRPLHETP